MVKKWFGSTPNSCQLCNTPFVDKFIDGRLQVGVWALMCPRCHEVNGVGLGTGRGQVYTLKTLEKIDG